MIDEILGELRQLSQQDGFTFDLKESKFIERPERAYRLTDEEIRHLTDWQMKEREREFAKFSRTLPLHGTCLGRSFSRRSSFGTVLTSPYWTHDGRATMDLDEGLERGGCAARRPTEVCIRLATAK